MLCSSNSNVAGNSTCCHAGVGLLTTGGSGFTWGDALCITSAVLFGVHKFRTETVTERFKSETRELVAVQLLVLAVISSVICVPELADAAHGRSPGGISCLLHSLTTTACTDTQLHARKALPAKAILQPTSSSFPEVSAAMHICMPRRVAEINVHPQQIFSPCFLRKLQIKS